MLNLVVQLGEFAMRGAPRIATRLGLTAICACCIDSLTEIAAAPGMTTRGQCCGIDRVNKTCVRPARSVVELSINTKDTGMDSLCLDLGKDEIVAFLIDADGNPIHDKPRTFNQTPRGYRQLLKWMRRPADTRVVFEATGVYSKRLVRALNGSVASMHELNPRIIKRFAISMTQTKTDQADVRAIADVVHTLTLKRPEKLEQSRVICDPQRDNLALWLQEYDRLRRVIARLKNQIDNLTHETADDASIILQRRRDELARLQDDQRQVRRQVDRAFKAWKSEEAALACSITGIATLTAASILTSIHHIEQFQSADAFKAYFGMYPRRRQSGSHESKSRMAKNGNRLVRHNLWNAARSAARHNPVCRELFERLVAQGKHEAAAYGAVARKLLQILYGVLKNKQPFQIQPLST